MVYQEIQIEGVKRHFGRDNYNIEKYLKECIIKIMKELEIVDFRLIDNSIEILCYEGDFNKYFDDENQFCHHFIIKNVGNNKDLEYLTENYENYLMNIVYDENKIIFYDYSNGNEIILTNIKLIEIKNGYEKILYKKIQHLIENYDNTNEALVNIVKKIDNITIFLKNELEKTNRKIEYYKTQNDNKLLNKNIDKNKIINKILDKINE